ncbi:hypothetical protein MKX03_032618 [Papaver bracteatum]|nr:hypothetical protein MKX03_032618 [Papaver bracteatum]
MGKRGRVQLKRIENKNNGQVSFSKRKPSLIKKANDIYVLCDAEVALIVFSPKGELFEYPTDAWYVLGTLSTYFLDLSYLSQVCNFNRHCCVAEELVATDQELRRNWCSEYTSVKEKVEVLQRNQSVKELQNLEHQLDTSLKNIKSRKNQLLYESISELQRKEKSLKEQNTVLGEKIKEKEQELGTSGQQQCNQAQAQNTYPKAQNSPTIIFSQELPYVPPARAIVIPRWMLGLKQ